MTEQFRFAVNVPKAITHERRLSGSGELLDRFLADATALGGILVHLPLSLPFRPEVAGGFLTN